MGRHRIDIEIRQVVWEMCNAPRREWSIAYIAYLNGISRAQAYVIKNQPEPIPGGLKEVV